MLKLMGFKLIFCWIKLTKPHFRSSQFGDFMQRRLVADVSGEHNGPILVVQAVGV